MTIKDIMATIVTKSKVPVNVFCSIRSAVSAIVHTIYRKSLYLPSHSWYSFTDHERMEGRVAQGANSNWYTVAT